MTDINKVNLSVYDLKGRKIETLVNDVKSPGKYIVNFNAQAIPSGVYLYRLVTANEVRTKKMVVMK
ncbi:MAG: T9SS type A sorting domain-containing protein [Candidatus Marinimicrobia bacterium]|nr:T9SS type A sorting domain-containing protein [Candidatus Neomarinimicrobiota bacterium]